MSMVCGLDLHRRQVTFDALDTRSGEVWRGRMWQPDRGGVRRWLRGDVARRAGGDGDGGVHRLALRGGGIHRGRVRGAPRRAADTQAARGNKHRAKTDRSDARLLRELFQYGVAVPGGVIRSPSTRALLAGDEVTLTPAARQRIQAGYAMMRRRARSTDPGSRVGWCAAVTGSAVRSSSGS
jgi:hypothetical protein